MSQAYVYALIVDGVTRYIGKGTGRRAIRHVQKAEAYVRAKRLGSPPTVPYLYRRLASAMENGQLVEAVILRDGMSDADAFELEAFLVEEAWDQLWNLAPGGEGLTSERAKLIMSDPIVRAKWAKYLQDPEFLAKRAASIKASMRARFAARPEEAQRISKMQREAWQRPGAREARAARMSIDRRLPDGPKARIIAAIGTGGATLDQIHAMMPDLDRRTVVVRTLHKLLKRGEIEKRGGKFDGVWFRTNVTSIAV